MGEAESLENFQSSCRVGRYSICALQLHANFFEIMIDTNPDYNFYSIFL